VSPAAPDKGFERGTVAIPVAKGLDLRTPDRLVAPGNFLTLENARHLRSVGLTRRRGHAEATPQFLDLSSFGSAASTDPTSTPADRDPYDPDITLPSQWLWGYGVLPDSGVDPVGVTNQWSTNRNPGCLFGAAKRGSEAVAWDGFRLFTNRADGW